MVATNTTENVFRFLQLRAPAPIEPYPEIVRLRLTPFAAELATSREKQSLARRALQEPTGASALLEGGPARQLLDATRTVLARHGTVADLRSMSVHNANGYENELAQILDAVSDLLLAIKFANTRRRYPVRDLDRLFKGASLLGTPPGPHDSVPLAKRIQRPLSLPELFSMPMREGGQSARQQKLQSSATATTTQLAAERTAVQRLNDALEELSALARPELLELPPDLEDGQQQSSTASLFALNAEGARRLSPNSRAVLTHLGLRSESESLEHLIQVLETALAAQARTFKAPTAVTQTPVSSEPEERPYIRDVGVADLLVVKQHLKRYDRVDIAHIESVLQGEKKSRTHRALERTEETITIERETLQERETELETAERFEMNRETARTVRRDQKFGFGLTVSGKYGPTVEFSSNLQADVSTSTEDSVRSATTYARDVVERSLERIVERVREEQVRVLIREQEETNVHELTNGGTAHVNGVYQFVEKVLESQAFNYGIRQMFDFMVPEPASYVWHLEQSDTELNIPTPPPALESVVPNAGHLNPGNYLRYAAQFGGDGVEAPPPFTLSTAVALTHGPDPDDESEEGQPRSVIEKELTVPAGYRPYRAIMHPLALTDDTLTVGIVIGHAQRVWKPGPGQLTNVGNDHRLGHATLQLSLANNSYPFEAESKIPVQVVAFETHTYSLAVEVLFQRTEAAYQAWQIKTYDKLAAANRERLERYAQQVAELRAKAEATSESNAIARFGSAPSLNVKTVQAELKKHCIAIFTRQRYESFDAVQEGEPPYFDFVEAAEEGAFIRFFEQAFEWDQMQYVFYPYFWGRQRTWAERFLRREVDPEFQEFLQSGAARIVVPVRPGFEIPLTHYLETGEIWNGDGELPPINSPLYLPIITEIQERTGASQDEIPVGEPWPTHLPTPLVILRREDDLPEWERVSEEGWEWEEAADETSSGNLA